MEGRKGDLFIYLFFVFADMVMKDGNRQIKAELMKDKASIGDLSGEAARHDMVVKMEEYGDSRRANLPFPGQIDLTFISISWAFIAALMNGKTIDILVEKGCLLELKKRKEMRSWWQWYIGNTKISWMYGTSVNPRQHGEKFQCLAYFSTTCFTLKAETSNSFLKWLKCLITLDQWFT